MSHTHLTKTLRGYTASVHTDDEPLDPRKEYDNQATMVCFHRKYTLGDKHSYTEPSEAVAAICGLDADDLTMNFDTHLNAAKIVWLPMFMYDHSGLTIATTPFPCRFDSGQIGFIYITNDDAKDEGHDVSDPKGLEATLNLLKSEVEIYDQYLRGECYRYTITAKDGEVAESSSGFYGTAEDCLKEAVANIPDAKESDTDAAN